MEPKDMKTGTKHYSTYEAKKDATPIAFVSLAVVLLTAVFAVAWRACGMATNASAPAVETKDR